jgi:ANTAR domain-containing protein/PAS domain-containing protein
VSPSHLEHSGAFRFDPASDTWTWGEEVYAIYGFSSGEVVPTTELILSHQHPDDRAAVDEFLASALRDGVTGSLWHRILDAQATVRQVVTTASGELDEDGTPTGLSGHVVDVSEAVRRTVSQEVDAALELIGRSRPLIEQAKGALMSAYAIDAEQAFALLRRYSQLRNVKVREVARVLVDAIATDGGLPRDTRLDLNRLVTEGAAPALEDGS